MLLSFAVYRLTPIAFDLMNTYLNGWHWLALSVSVFYMAYAEGYQGFFKAFAPRVVVRASYLRQHPRVLHVALAPLFCMGFIHATRRRRIISFSVTSSVICLVLVVRLLSQPWRGIVDAGVVVGLILGIASILYFLVQSIRRPGSLDLPADVPVGGSGTVNG